MNNKSIAAVSGNLGALLAGSKKTAEVVNTGQPIEFDMDLIDEDPNQPRSEDNPGFSPESIAEIGATIKARGVKTPISVRDNPDKPGRLLINHGARRFRGSKWAEKKTIPGFKDNSYLEEDQVVENLQRDGLTPREIANYIGRELAKKKKKGEIAAAIGKSAAYITQHATLLDLPDPIAVAFNNGRCKDVTVINELVTAYKTKPAEVTDWLSDDTQEITRGSVKLLREFLDNKNKGTDASGSSDGGSEGDDGGQGNNDDQGKTGDSKKPPKEKDPEKITKAIVMVEHNGRPARLIMSRRPPAEGFAWLKYEDDGQEFETSLSEVKLTALIEG